MLHWTGIFAYPFEVIGGITDWNILNYANLFYGLLGLTGFYFARKSGFKSLWDVLTVFFLNSFFTFLWEHDGGDSESYFLGFMISEFLAALQLFAVGFIKEKQTKK